ncbi:MAG: DUF368 domain-containing protein [Bacteroidales bacterium]|nr:DUF368 domain-containing protein [Bacteroidales bacterium]
MRSFLHYLSVAIKGIFMGAANVVPGVSGGTIALLTGIYQEIIDSIKSIGLSSLKLLFKGKFAEFWKSINGTFLFALTVGIVISFLSLAKLMQFLLERHPIPTWAFFFGLILISAYYILRDLKGLKWYDFISLIIGIAAGVAICLLSPAETTDALWFIFLCGAISMSTMILPGISGSFVLLLLGKYAYMMDALGNLDITVIAVFIIGAIVGLLSFSHLLSWLMKRFYNATLCFLSGLMLGALIKVWPWKEVTVAGTDIPLLPGSFAGEPHVASAVIAALCGIALVVVINTVAARKQKSEQV